MKRFYRKYKNQKTEFQGVLYDSKLEARIAAELAWLQMSGEIVEIRRQVSVKLYGKGGTLICVHKVDFVILRNEPRRWEAHEAKGPITDGWRLKLKLFLDNYPKIQYYTHFDDWVCIGKLTRKPKGGKGVKTKKAKERSGNAVSRRRVTPKAV